MRAASSPGVCVYVCVCLYVCMCLMYVCVCLYLCLSMYVCVSMFALQVSSDCRTRAAASPLGAEPRAEGGPGPEGPSVQRAQPAGPGSRTRCEQPSSRGSSLPTGLPQSRCPLTRPTPCGSQEAWRKAVLPPGSEQ